MVRGHRLSLLHRATPSMISPLLRALGCRVHNAHQCVTLVPSKNANIYINFCLQGVYTYPMIAFLPKHKQTKKKHLNLLFKNSIFILMSFSLFATSSVVKKTKSKFKIRYNLV